MAGLFSSITASHKHPKVVDYVIVVVITGDFLSHSGIWINLKQKGGAHHQWKSRLSQN